ncbi:MAG TPA: urease accessory protein UreH [Candidatus Polarisedimenticolia bacterium]|nr:urease accessory protein UreH [Candidatus Polarisedimenticolia bacterium]
MLAVLGLGFLLGLRHALDADHIAAVGAMVSERPGWRTALRTGLLWGLGHSAALFIAGLLVIGLHLVIPEMLARALEAAVALMVLLLGGTALARALRSRADWHSHYHAHGRRVHRHLHFHDATDGHDPHHIARIGLKPLLVGTLHGLAGSAALTLLVLARIASPTTGLAYLAIFGIGSIGGMALLSVGIGLPFTATLALPRWNLALRVAAGAAGVVFGIVYALSQFHPA